MACPIVTVLMEPDEKKLQNLYEFIEVVLRDLIDLVATS